MNWNRVLPLSVGLIFSLPFCMPFHYAAASDYPLYITTFILLVFGIVGAVFDSARIQLRNVSASFPLVLLVVVIIQQIIHPSQFTATWLPLVVGLFFLWMYCLLLTGFEDGDAIFKCAVSGVAIGALSNAALGLIQLFISVADDNNLEVFGFLNQRNLFADYLSIGVVAIAWLGYRRIIGRAAYLSTLLVVSLAIAFSGSRSSFVFISVVVLAGCFGGLNVFRPKDGFGKVLLQSGIVVLCVMLLAPWGLKSIQHILSSSAVVATGMERVVAPSLGDATSTGIRGALIRQAIDIFLGNIFTGVGWDNFTIHQQQLMGLPQYAKLVAWPVQVQINAHNSVVHLAAENGIFLGGFILFFVAFRIYKQLRHGVGDISLASMVMMGILVAHSMLEYPLWNYNFLVVFVIIMVVSDGYSLRGAGKIALGKIGRWSVCSITLLGSVLGCVSIGWYWILFVNSNPSWIYRENVTHVKNLLPLQQNPFLDYFSSSLLLAHIEPSMTILGRTTPGISFPGEVEMLSKINAYRPVPKSLLWEVVYRARSGETQRAVIIIRQALMAYPSLKGWYLNQIRSLNDPRLSQIETYLLQEV